MCQPNNADIRRGESNATMTTSAAPQCASNAGSASDVDQPGKGLRVLICSENVPPQVNGIARRIGMYVEGLKNLGCHVDLLHPDSGPTKVLSHLNPWNFTARMMIINPLHLYNLFKISLATPYDVVHIVMPANLTGMWILAMFKVLRCLQRIMFFFHILLPMIVPCPQNKGDKPALVVSWHCNIIDYTLHFIVKPLRCICVFFFYQLFGMLPFISDRILTPTRQSEPQIVKLWKRDEGTVKEKLCAGVCYTGVNKTEFSPDAKDTHWGRRWLQAKDKFLANENKKYLIVCVGRLSPEKGVDQLIKVLPHNLLKDCALWLVGDGPHRPEFERISRDMNISVKFLGYQSGEALHSVYAVADLFVCPSLTETFGQTVNEALASGVRVVLPTCPVFCEAYGEVIPKNAFYEACNKDDMARAISVQLVQGSNGDMSSMPDLNKLKTWGDASLSLLQEYLIAASDRESIPHTFTLKAWIHFPIWFAVTVVTAMAFFIFAQIRTLFGGSVRLFFKAKAEEAMIKVQSLNRLPSFERMHSMERDRTE